LNPWHKKKETYIAIGTVFLFILAITSYDAFIGYPKVEKVLSELESEFHSISAPEDVKEIGFRRSHKTNIATIEAKYTTDMSYDEVIKFYESELLK
jgi:hypothetical protein